MPIVADVALLDPTQTDRAISAETKRNEFSHEDGFYQALVEAGIPFEFVADQVLSLDELAPFKVLILPNAERLSDQQCDVIRTWVSAGGAIVAAYQTSLLDEKGDARNDFGLADVLGVELNEPSRGPVKNNYIALMEDHPLHSGLEGASRIIGGSHLLSVTAAPDTDVPFRFIPDFPDLPMEEVYPREEPDQPAVTARELPGGGRAVYFGFDIGSLFWEALQADHAQLIANATRWALHGNERVCLSGPGLVDVAVRENASGIAVSLVNLTNPMAMRGAIRETVRLAGQRVEITIPPGRTIASAKLLVAERDVNVDVVDGRATVELPPIDLLEVVKLTWA
jgi:hypothetical protein